VSPSVKDAAVNAIGKEWRREPLYELDPEVNELVRAELRRQQDTLELIASENFASRAVLEATGSVLTNKYAEGYPGARYYGGCEIIDGVEQLAIDRCKQLFGAEHVNVQPHSGSSANLAALFALLKPGDTMLAMELAHGGHLTHGLHLNFSGVVYNAVPYHVRRDTETIDYDEVRELALAHQPKLIICGYSSYPRIIDFAAFRQIADECGALLLADIAHIAGLVAAGLHPNPVPFCDVVTSTTHKTLTGPRAGLIMCREEFAKAIDRAVFPGMQGGPLAHVIAAKAVCLRIARSEEFRRVQRQIVANAAALAETLADGGLRLVSGGTDVHLALIDMRGSGLNGIECQSLLESVNITANRNVVPFDDSPVTMASGLRVGSPAVTTRGFAEAEMRQTGRMILRAIAARGEPAVLAEIREEVLDLLEGFPLYEFL
jgi:glycine hydroxymethyltransferase